MKKEKTKNMQLNLDFLDIPHGPVVEGPPAHAGVIGSYLVGKMPHATEQLSHAPQLLSLRSGACTPQQEKPSLSAARESPQTAAKTKRNQK